MKFIVRRYYIPFIIQPYLLYHKTKDYFINQLIFNL